MSVFTRHPLQMAVCAVLSCSSAVTGAQDAAEDGAIEETLVISKATTYANNETNLQMRQQLSDLTSVNSLIDNLPGVSVQEGDAFGLMTGLLPLACAVL